MWIRCRRRRFGDSPVARGARCHPPRTRAECRTCRRGILAPTIRSASFRGSWFAGTNRSQSARIERIEAFNHTGKRLTDLRYSRAIPKACAYGVHRGVLFEELHSEARAAGAKIELA